MTESLLIAIGSLVVTLLGSYLFTNGIEWYGKRMKLPDGAVGSVLSAVGTALPETIIPLIAIFLGSGVAKKEIGTGAILGAPFMLSTLTLPLAGLGVLFFSLSGKRTKHLHLNFKDIETDLKFFLISFSLAVAAAGVNNRLTHFVIGISLFVIYARYLKMVFGRPPGEHLSLDPLLLEKFFRDPGLTAILSQIFLGLGLIIGGAWFFIEGLERLAGHFRISPMILSLLITPVATELPEKFNSLIWISKKKDYLAISNITGALVFQSTFPVAIGLFGTAWHFDQIGLSNIMLTLAAAIYFYGILLFKKKWAWYHLAAGSLAYLGYLLILVFHN
ncbi:MAG TPA: sodium:calcium antiporter [Nitrospiria bacterium]|nr:sodium:calcium antiporter [Nitrospiria bacterium]